MLRRTLLAVLALAVAASAQTLQKRAATSASQSPRQALIEMLTTKSDKVFEKHLPDALLTRLNTMKSTDKKTGKSSSPLKTSNSSIVASQDVHFFDAGPTFLVYTAPKSAQKIEVVIERDEMTADGDQIEFGFHVIQDGKPSDSALIPKVLVRMKQEANVWRLAEIGFSARVQLDDGAKLDELMNSVMSGMANMQTTSAAPKSDK